MQKDIVLIYSSLHAEQKWARLDGSFSLLKQECESVAMSFLSLSKAACIPAARWLHAVTAHVTEWNGLILQ